MTFAVETAKWLLVLGAGAFKVIPAALGYAWGPVTSVARRLNPRDAAQAVLVAGGVFVFGLNVAAVVTGDVGSFLTGLSGALLAGGSALAGLLKAAHAWLSPPTPPAPTP